MKQKVLFVFTCLFIIHSYSYANNNYVKHLTSWPGYSSRSVLDMNTDKNVMFIAIENLIKIQDVSNPTEPLTVCEIQLTATVQDLSYYDGFLYVSNGEGFHVFDVDDLTHHSRIYFHPLDNANNLFINDSYAVVVTEKTGLQFYSIESSSNVSPARAVSLSGLNTIKEVFINDKYVSVWDQKEGIYIYAIEEMIDDSVQPIGYFDQPGAIKHLFIQEQFAYISDKEVGFCIADFTNPELHLDHFCSDDIKSALASVIIDQYAYVITNCEYTDANGHFTEDKLLWILNVENPENIEMLDNIKLDPAPYQIHADNNHLYVSAFDQIDVYELTKDILTPQFDATPKTGDAPLTVSFTNKSIGDIKACKWHFGNGYTSTECSILHTYYNPGQYTVTLAISDNKRWYTHVENNCICVTKSQPGAFFNMNVISGVCPLSVEFVQDSTGNYTDVLWRFGDGNLSKENHPIHIYESPGIFVVTLTVSGANGSDDYSKTVYVYNNVSPISEWTARPVRRFCTDFQKKYGFAATTDSIDVLDIANPLNITVIDSIPMINQAESLFYTQDYLFAACGEDGLAIYLTFNPTSLSRVSKVPIDGFSSHVWVKNNYAYVSAMASGLSIFDLSAISSPTFVTRVQTRGEASVMKIVDEFAFIAEGYSGLSRYLHNNGIGFNSQDYFFRDDHFVSQFDLNRKYLYLAIKDRGMTIVQYNETDKALDTQWSSTTNYDALDICVRDNYAYMACGHEGLKVYNIEQVKAPTEINSLESYQEALDVVDVYPYLYLADGDAGLQIYVQPKLNQLELQTPKSIQRGQTYQAKVCLPYVYPQPLWIDIQTSQHILLTDESIIITPGNLSGNFSFFVSYDSPMDTVIPFKARAKDWFDDNSASIISENDNLKEYRSSHLPLIVPNAQSVTSTINVADKGTVKHLSIRLKIKTKVLENLYVQLKSPQNTSIVLFNRPGKEIKIFTDVLEINLDDRAIPVISDAQLPLAGCYKPQQCLSRLKGQQIQGKWTLLVDDQARCYDSALLSWSMFFDLSDTHAQSVLYERNDRPNLVPNKQQPTDLSINIKSKISQPQYAGLPEIQMLEVPPMGNRIKLLRGIVHSSAIFSGYLVVYILKDKWHLKPRWISPITNLKKDGQWQCDITTQYGDETATKVAVFLFAKDVQPFLQPQFPVLPETFFQKAVSFKIYCRVIE